MIVHYDEGVVDTILTNLYSAKFKMEDLDGILPDGDVRDDLSVNMILGYSEKAYSRILDLIEDFEKIQDLGEEIRIEEIRKRRGM